MADIARTVAIETLCDGYLHKSFILPPSTLPEAVRPFRITYSDLGYHSPSASKSSIDESNEVVDSDPCVVLFIAGLLGGRYVLCRSAGIARRLKVRLITIDRPGLGGTTPAPIEQRLAVQLAAVPALLSHLGIKHVTLASHSGGAPYLLATLLAHRGLLHPKRPHIVMLAPWVHPKDSGTLLLRLAAALPSQAIGRFHSCAKIINNTLSFSSGLNQGLSRKPTTIAVSRTGASDERQDGGKALENAVLSEMDNLAAKYIFAENMEGSSDDAILFLRRHQHPGTANGDLATGEGRDWLDYQTLAVAIVAQEKRVAPDAVDSEKLHIDVLHSEKDIMAGAGGARYFDDCWASAIPHSSVSYNSRVVEGVNHDSILDPTHGVSERWLQNVAQRHYG